ncbi:MAG: prolyl oligopeptidase family serine peptidase [Betaproteobacteria bacterium]|nr:prolyl oligopeptidase family serine peptidase [Betaproteobacteria bacterium]
MKHARESWLARCTLNGVDASDFMDVSGSIERWEDWCKAWSVRAAIHEEMGRAALAARKYVSAAEHLCRAAATYHFGAYVFVHDAVQQRAAYDKAVACHTLALPHMDPPGERVLIPYQNTRLAAVVRKPRNLKGRPPLVLMVMGLDSTKEEMMTFETAFLDRGMATLAFEGPGQGESQYDLAIRHDYENVVGPVIDWVLAHDDLDGSRIGISGISLGGYYAPRAAAFEKRIKACIANGGPYDWGALWDTLPELTRRAFRARSHSANDGEARQRAKLLTLEGIAKRIQCPLFVIAGGLDTVCPPEDAKRLAAEAKGPVELLVIEDGYHVAHNRAYRHRPQSADWMAEQLGVEAR